MMQTARVLLVEDDVNSARLLKDLLTAKGAVVTHENNGVDAIERAKKESFDLIILDLRLPGENGFVVAENLTRQDGQLAPPIIVTSAFPDKQNRMRAFQAGVDAFLNKPLDLQELVLLAANFSRRQQHYDAWRLRVARHLNDLGEKRLQRSGHSQSVVATCQEMVAGLPTPAINTTSLYEAALLHDIGLAFSSGEDDDHAAIGAGILAVLGFPPTTIFLVKGHHITPGPDPNMPDLPPGLLSFLQILQAAEKANEP
ncbi:response regulator [Moorella naiadis]|uniref:response regulator n=1 Tax=Moorella naiadis (nom. illeg.) TaxID=3093670 RepID=UPI003D9CBE0D